MSTTMVKSEKKENRQITVMHARGRELFWILQNYTPVNAMKFFIRNNMSKT